MSKGIIKRLEELEREVAALKKPKRAQILTTTHTISVDTSNFEEALEKLIKGDRKKQIRINSII